jgi:acetyl-CoA C-acetyltransferase
MIRFTERQLRAPRQVRPVYVVAAGQSDFRKRYPEKKTEELCIEALRMLALENELKVDGVQELKGYIHSCIYGHFADHFGDQLLGEAVIHDRLGLDPLGNVGVKTGGATGGSALWMAANTVASGYSDCTLCMGWERMDEVDTWTGNHYISTAADKDWETELGHIYTGYYALMAQRYWKTFGRSSPEFRRTMSKIAVKNRGYACSNPFAQAPARITVEDVESSPIVADPLRFYDACLMSVGASAVLLCDEDTAYRLSDNPMRFFIAAGSHTLRTADRRHMEIPLLPNEKDDEDIKKRYRELYGDEKTERYPGFTGFLASRMAAHYAYGMVNPVTGQPGRLPSNMSGGLIGCMHAVGATGIMQVAEVFWQLQNRWSHFHERDVMWQMFGKEKPADFENLQITGARRGLAISHAGVGSHVTFSILMRPDALIRTDS